LSRYPGASTEDEEVTTRRAETTSRSNRGREFTEEHKKALSEAGEGRTLSEEHRQHIAEAMEGRVFTDEHRENKDRANRDFWYSERGDLARAKSREALTGIVRSDETRDKISDSKTGVPLSEETKEAQRTFWRSPEGRITREKMNEGLRAYYSSEEGQSFLRARDQGKFKNDFNSKEQEFAEFLEYFFPGQLRFSGNGQFYIGSLCPDFIMVNGEKKVIEYFGAPWHPPHHEEKRAEDMRKHGYEVLVVWSWQLDEANKTAEGLNKLLKRIAKFTGYIPKELL